VEARADNGGDFRIESKGGVVGLLAVVFDIHEDGWIEAFDEEHQENSGDEVGGKPEYDGKSDSPAQMGISGGRRNPIFVSQEQDRDCGEDPGIAPHAFVVVRRDHQLTRAGRTRKRFGDGDPDERNGRGAGRAIGRRRTGAVRHDGRRVTWARVRVNWCKKCREKSAGLTFAEGAFSSSFTIINSGIAAGD